MPLNRFLEYLPTPSDIRHMTGLFVPEYSEPELPPPDFFGSDRPIYQTIPKSQRPTKLPTRIPMRRADERRGGLETLPHARFDPTAPVDELNNQYFGSPNRVAKAKRYSAMNNIEALYAMTHTMGAAKKLGLPTIPPEELAALAMKEGREDFGFNNTFKPKAPADVKFRRMLDASFNLSDMQKNFLGLVNYAQRTAKAKGVPFAAVWNGLGVNKYGKSGFDYAKSLAAHRAAVQRPENQQLLGFIRSAYAAGLKNGLPSARTRVRDEDPYYKSDPTYEYHTPTGNIRPVTEVVARKAKRVGTRISDAVTGLFD